MSLVHWRARDSLLHPLTGKSRTAAITLIKGKMEEVVLPVDKVDIISLSLGTSVGWLDNTPIQIYQDYLATIGVHIVAAAGNERTEGLFYSEQPAAGLLTNAVGATYATPVFCQAKVNPD